MSISSVASAPVASGSRGRLRSRGGLGIAGCLRDLGFIAKKSAGRPCEDSIHCRPDPRPASLAMWSGCDPCVQASLARRHRGQRGRWWLSRADAAFACVPMPLPSPILPTPALFLNAAGAGSLPAVPWLYRSRPAAHTLRTRSVLPSRPAARKGQSGDPESPWTRARFRRQHANPPRIVP
jgi:hypothetical protein